MDGCDGSSLWELSKILLIIGTWEILQRLVRSCLRVKASVEQWNRTEAGNVAALPLGPKIPPQGAHLVLPVEVRFPCRCFSIRGG